jgi:3-deoxy-D-manno-octulosonate 8-phosphate phosphatase (KDO 8-P phosphatase)
VRGIKAVGLDIDGVLTDGGVILTAAGEEAKRLCFADIMGVSIGRREGLVFALISGEGGPLVRQIAAKLQVSHVYEHCRDKAGALQSFSDAIGVPLAETAFMGDDVNALPAMRIAGLAAAPCSARPEVLKEAAFVSSVPGGSGAARDLIDRLLAERREAR